MKRCFGRSNQTNVAAGFSLRSMRNLKVAATVVLLFGSGVNAQAPQIGTYSPPVTNPRPVISPYLNLNRTGVNPAINYFGIVRPQMENHQAIQNLQQQVQVTQGMMQTQPGPMANDEIAPTGRTVGSYFNYSHYFPLYGRGAGGNTAAGSNITKR
jgi:hypothetical protein